MRGNAQRKESAAGRKHDEFVQFLSIDRSARFYYGEVIRIVVIKDISAS